MNAEQQAKLAIHFSNASVIDLNMESKGRYVFPYFDNETITATEINYKPELGGVVLEIARVANFKNLEDITVCKYQFVVLVDIDFLAVSPPAKLSPVERELKLPFNK